MTQPSNSQTVYNNAQAGVMDPNMPGTSAVIGAWAAVQDFTGNWAVTTYNTILNLISIAQGVNQ